MSDNPILCRRCGAKLSEANRYQGYEARLCSRHWREHLATVPPFACTSADLAARDPDNDPDCESCGHPSSKHEFGGCVQMTGRMMFSYGVPVEDTGPYRCGCEAIDPMCQVLPPKASVTDLPPRQTLS